jgi:hypothetical protein
MYTRHPFHSGKGGTRQHHHVGERKNARAAQPKKIGAAKEENLLAKAGRKNRIDRQTKKIREEALRKKKNGGHTSYIARGVEQERSEQTSVDIIALITLIQQEDPSFTIEEI